MLNLMTLINYTYTLNQLEQLVQMVNDEIDKILALTVSARDKFTAELIIYDYLVKTINYNRSNKTILDYNILGVTLNREGVCLGIAKVFKLLLDRLGIPALIVLGDIKTQDGYVEAHAWNMLSINGELYHADLTLDLNSRMHYKYFNVTTSELSDRKCRYYYPICNMRNYNYYHYYNCAFRNINDLENYLIQQVNNGVERYVVKDWWIESLQKIL